MKSSASSLCLKSHWSRYQIKPLSGKPIFKPRVWYQWANLNSVCPRSLHSAWKPSRGAAPSPRPFGSRVAVGGAGWDPFADRLLVPEMMYRPGGVLSEVYVPCCCLRDICSAILGSKMSLEANRCFLCINKYNTILRKFGYKEMLLCMKLSTRHLSSSKLSFFFFLKRRCIITGKMFLFFYFLSFYIYDGKKYAWKFLFGNFIFCFILSGKSS